MLYGTKRLRFNIQQGEKRADETMDHIKTKGWRTRNLLWGLFCSEITQNFKSSWFADLELVSTPDRDVEIIPSLPSISPSPPGNAFFPLLPTPLSSYFISYVLVKWRRVDRKIRFLNGHSRAEAILQIAEARIILLLLTWLCYEMWHNFAYCAELGPVCSQFALSLNLNPIHV